MEFGVDMTAAALLESQASELNWIRFNSTAGFVEKLIREMLDASLSLIDVRADQRQGDGSEWGAELDFAGKKCVLMVFAVVVKARLSRRGGRVGQTGARLAAPSNLQCLNGSQANEISVYGKSNLLSCEKRCVDGVCRMDVKGREGGRRKGSRLSELQEGSSFPLKCLWKSFISSSGLARGTHKEKFPN